jgi:hypothetical protein
MRKPWAQRDMAQLRDNKGGSNDINSAVSSPKANFGILMTKIKFW